jgi:hypothetical protein
MASLFDYVKRNKGPVGMGFDPSSRRTAPSASGSAPMSGGYTYTGSRYDGGVRPINQLNRARVNQNRLNKFGSIGGGGRSNLDARRGYSNQGIARLPLQPDVIDDSVSITEDDDQFAFEDRGLAKNYIEDQTRMLTDLTPNINAPSLPGLAGLFPMLGSSISNNQQDHKIINAAYGRASPAKTMAFFNKAMIDAGTDVGTNNQSTLQIGDTSTGSSLGQAMKYFERAGISKQNMDRFMDPNDKFYGSEAYLRSQAGGSGAEDFDIGMSFIKNAKSSANIADNLTRANRAIAAQDAGLGGPLSPAGGPIPINQAMQSGIDYDAMGLAPDPENDLLYGEPGFGEPRIVPNLNKPEPYNPYRDEDYGAPLRDIDMYEGIYESPLADTLYNEELVAASPNPRLRNNPSFMKPRDTVAIESMGGGMNAFDSRRAGPFEYLPFYSGLGDFNFSPELEEDDVVLGDGSIVNSRLDLYN